MKTKVSNRINELQSTIDSTVKELKELKERRTGKISVDDIHRLDELSKQLLVSKAIQAELIELMQGELGG